MVARVLMPALSPTMTDGHLVRWIKSEGDNVESGDVLAEIETDKATMEVEAVDAGILGKIMVPAGTEGVSVNSLIALILEDGEDLSVITTYLNADIQPSTMSQIILAEPNHAKKMPSVESSPSEQSSSSHRIIASPLARRIADIHGIDLSRVTGSGPSGRIIKVDVEDSVNVKISPSTTSISVHSGSLEPKEKQYTDTPLSSLRKTIAKRLTESKQTIPHFYLTRSVWLDRLSVVRRELNASKRAQIKISVNDFMIRACGLALMEVPALNATWHDQFIRRYNSADISVAVSISGGLITPIIFSIHKKTLIHISTEMKELANRAKSGTLKPHEYQGGGFSVSNLGMYGVTQFNAIINPPQVAILAIGAGQDIACVQNGTVCIQNMCQVTLSIDHRAVDGAEGAQFLSILSELVENPLYLL